MGSNIPGTCMLRAEIAQDEIIDHDDDDDHRHHHYTTILAIITITTTIIINIGINIINPFTSGISNFDNITCCFLTMLQPNKNTLNSKDW